ncbi:uncharacterized protein LOC113143076, partial [Mastacembelus armatus]|uniref:uncharacterized protein LOC113143076 n=1 Tax=Mastacembelus armatus TaxID=205130 RepID=UPI000E45C731
SVLLEVMDYQETSNIFQQFWKRTQKVCDCESRSQCRQKNRVCSTSESRLMDIQMSERAKRAALTRHAEALCAAQKARDDAVLERLGLSVPDVILPSNQPPPVPRINRKSPRGQRVSPVFDDNHLHGLDNEEDDSFWDEVQLGSQMAVLACQKAQMTDKDKSPTASLYSLSSIDTPSELREISLIKSPTKMTPTPPPPQALPLLRRERRVSRLPVFSAKLSGAGKEVADGLRLLTAKNKVKDLVERLEQFQLTSIHSHQHPVAEKMAPAMKPVAQTPTKNQQKHKSRSQPETFSHPAKTVTKAKKKTVNNCSVQSVNKDRDVLQPLNNPVESLSGCFSMLSSDDWMEKINGLKKIRALAQHHSGILKTKLHETCLVLSEEVKSLRSAVACAAMNTIAELYVCLQKAMDPEVEGTGRALLQKLAQTTNAFIHQQANLALDAMVQNCSPGRTVSCLLNTGLNHRSPVVRGSMAEHLHQLTDRVGAACVLTSGRTVSGRFVIAVSKMVVDGAPKVRHNGQMVLQKLALHRDFLNLWTRIIPEEERLRLDKIFIKAKKNGTLM